MWGVEVWLHGNPLHWMETSEAPPLHIVYVVL